MKKSLYITIIISLFLLSCNNKPEYEPNRILEIGKEYPLIKNQDFKINPIIPTIQYPQRCGILTSEKDLSNLPIQVLDRMPELQFVDFKHKNVIIVSLISDEAITRYVPQVRYNAEEEFANITMTYYSDGTNVCLAEWFAAFQCSKENISNFIVSYSIHCE